MASQYCVSDSFVDYDGHSISSKGFLPRIVDRMVIWLNSPIPVHFSSLIPKMSMFTFAFSCLTTSYLLWFVDLTFQVPVRYCSLQHQTLLPSAVTSTTGHCIHSGFISSFFLVLFLQSSPVTCWALTDLESSSFVSYLFAFSYCSWESKGKNAEVVCHCLLHFQFGSFSVF